MAIVGRIDRIGDRSVYGWAMENQDPAEHVVIEILSGDTVVAQGQADIMRADLASAGMGAGDHAFEITLPPDVKAGEISARARSSASVQSLDIAGADEHKFSELYDIVVARYDALFAAMAQRTQNAERALAASATQSLDEQRGSIDRMLQDFNSRLETAEVSLMRLDEMVRRLTSESEKRKRKRLLGWL